MPLSTNQSSQYFDREHFQKLDFRIHYLMLLFFNLWIHSSMPQKPLSLSCPSAFSINPASDSSTPLPKEPSPWFRQKDLLCFDSARWICLPCVPLHINSRSILKSQLKTDATPAKPLNLSWCNILCEPFLYIGYSIFNLPEKKHHAPQ